MENNLKEEKTYYEIKNKVIRFEKNRVVFVGQKSVKSFQTKFNGKTKTINFFGGKPKIVVDGQTFWGVKSVGLRLFERFNCFDVYG